MNDETAALLPVRNPKPCACGCDSDKFTDSRDYGDDDRHRAYDASFPEPEGADRW